MGMPTMYQFYDNRTGQQIDFIYSDSPNIWTPEQWLEKHDYHIVSRGRNGAGRCYFVEPGYWPNDKNY